MNLHPERQNNPSRGRRSLVLQAIVFGSLFLIVAAASRFEWPTDLEFQEIGSPVGYRRLLLDGSASAQGSGFNPLLQLEPASPLEDGVDVVDLCNDLLNQAIDPRLGPNEASVNVVEFFDYQCPYCRVVSGFLPDLQAENEQLQVIYKEWPILGEPSMLAARYALAANRQGDYLAFHKRLMSSRVIPNETAILDIAEQISLDAAALSAEQGDHRIDEAIDTNAKLAKAFGFKGTPSFVVGRTLVEGAITKKQLQQLIDVELNDEVQENC